MQDPQADNEFNNKTQSPRYIAMVLLSTFCFGAGLYSYFIPVEDMTTLLGNNAEFAKKYAIDMLIIGGIISALNIYFTFINKN